MTVEQEVLKEILENFKDGKLELTKPIPTVDGKGEIKEISVQSTTDASFFYSMPLNANDFGAYKEVIANLTGLTSSQVGSLHINDYSSLVIFVGNLTN